MIEVGKLHPELENTAEFDFGYDEERDSWLLAKNAKCNFANDQVP